MTAYVTRNAAGELVLVDPVAEGVIRAMYQQSRASSLANCRELYALQKDRVAHFANRVDCLGHTADEVVIVLISVDDLNGRPLVDDLMPGHDWDEIRKTGAMPIARGIAERGGIEDALSFFDTEAHAALKAVPSDKLPVVVIDCGVAAVFQWP